MRIHTKLTFGDLQDANKASRTYMARNTKSGSRTRDHKFDVILSGSSSRHMNSGQYGALDIGDGMAATWDEWGIFLGTLFARDPFMHCWAYMGAEDFNQQTGDRFRYAAPNGIAEAEAYLASITWANQCPNHKWKHDWSDPYEKVSCSTCQKCGATRQWYYGTLRKRPVSFKVSPTGFTTTPRNAQQAERYLASA